MTVWPNRGIPRLESGCRPRCRVASAGTCCDHGERPGRAAGRRGGNPSPARAARPRSRAGQRRRARCGEAQAAGLFAAHRGATETAAEGDAEAGAEAAGGQLRRNPRWPRPRMGRRRRRHPRLHLLRRHRSPPGLDRHPDARPPRIHRLLAARRRGRMVAREEGPDGSCAGARREWRCISLPQPDRRDPGLPPDRAGARSRGRRADRRCRDRACSALELTTRRRARPRRRHPRADPRRGRDVHVGARVHGNRRHGLGRRPRLAEVDVARRDDVRLLRPAAARLDRGRVRAPACRHTRGPGPVLGALPRCGRRLRAACLERAAAYRRRGSPVARLSPRHGYRLASPRPDGARRRGDRLGAVLRSRLPRGRYRVASRAKDQRGLRPRRDHVRPRLLGYRSCACARRAGSRRRLVDRGARACRDRGSPEGLARVRCVRLLPRSRRRTCVVVRCTTPRALGGGIRHRGRAARDRVRPRRVDRSRSACPRT